MQPTRPVVVTTRDRPGRLDALLDAAGIDVVHVPLIEIVDSDDPALTDAREDLGNFDWLVVTSVHGAERIGRAAAGLPHVRLAAVGTATASRLEDLAGRPVDVVPPRQTGADLVGVFPAATGDERVMVAQADRADATVVDGLTGLGYEVNAVTAYRTRLRRPSPDERALLSGADGVAFASGSAAIAWAEVVGTSTPPVVAAIGPTTARVATEHGLQVTHIAADHSVEGLANILTTALDDGQFRHRAGDRSPLPDVGTT